MGTKTEMNITDVSPLMIPQLTAPWQRRNLKDFSDTLFRVLEKVGIRYCLLAESPASESCSVLSVEIAVDPGDRGSLPKVLERLRAEGYLPLQSRVLAANDCRYDFAGSRDSELRLFSLTVLSPYPQGRLVTIDGEIFSRRQKRGKCWIASEADQYCYLLSKIAMNRKVSDFEQTRLLQLAKSIGVSQSESIAARLFGRDLQSKVVASSLDGGWAEILKTLRGRLRRATGGRAFSSWFVHTLLQFNSSVRRWFHPSGIYIVILGPDGAGKSTLVNKILEMLGPMFDSNRILQWRPQLIKPRERYSPYFNPPHAKPPHGSLESVLRIFAVLFDYWVGYPIVIRPLLADSSLLIYDRDFHDLLVDRLRYRYGGPAWLPEFAAKFIPQPETLYLTLDADTEVILSRKQEVAPDELRRQRVAYAELAAKLPNSTLIRTDISLETSISAVTGAVVTFLAKRFERSQPKVSPPPPVRVAQSRQTVLSREGVNSNS